MVMSTEPAPMNGHTIQVIGFGRRLVAYLIDGLILGVVNMLTSVLIHAIAGNAFDPGGITLLVNVGVGVAYFVAFWVTSGQTPGKKALGIRVVSTDGTPLTWGQAIMRYVGQLVSTVMLGLGFLWIAVDARRQGLHDKIANTLVVRADADFAGESAVTFVPSDPGRGALVIAIVMLLACALPFVAIILYIAVGKALGGAILGVQDWLDAASRAGTPQP